MSMQMVWLARETDHAYAHDCGVDAALGIGPNGVKQALLIIGTVHCRTEVSQENDTARCVCSLACWSEGGREGGREVGREGE